MTTRDDFAKAALIGLLSCDEFMRDTVSISRELRMTGVEEKIVQPKHIARCAYLIADAMLAAREAPAPPTTGRGA